jgi:hypothetical protein
MPVYEATAECDVHGRSCIVTSDVVGPSAGSLRATIYTQSVDGTVQLNRYDAPAIVRDATIDFN